MWSRKGPTALKSMYRNGVVHQAADSSESALHVCRYAWVWSREGPFIPQPLYKKGVAPQVANPGKELQL